MPDCEGTLNVLLQMLPLLCGAVWSFFLKVVRRLKVVDLWAVAVAVAVVLIVLNSWKIMVWGVLG